MMNENDSNVTTEIANANEEITMSSEQLEPVAAVTETSPAKPVLPPQRLTRRVYGAHKVYNTCITVGAFVYIAPASIAGSFDKKSAVRMDFLVSGAGADAVVIDLEGNEWICAGENGGCGPRLSALPLASREQFKKTWHSLSFSERMSIIRQLVPAKAAK